jgi:hypothetical protein
MRGTWRTDPQPNPLRIVLGIVALIVIVAVSLMAPSLRKDLAQRPVGQASPVPSASARR